MSHPNNREDRTKKITRLNEEIAAIHAGLVKVNNMFSKIERSPKEWRSYAREMHVMEQNKRSKILSSDDVCNIRILAGLCNTVEDFLRSV